MTEYIERKALIQKLNCFLSQPRYQHDVDDFFVGICDSISEVMSMPAADVVEVRRGNMELWKPRCTGRNATYKCSMCHKPCSSYYNDVGEWNYCPHCGAKMKGGE